MRLLGIDYGSKRIGLALSDEAGQFAFPHSVVQAGSDAVSRVVTLCRNEGVQKIVMGESLDYKGVPNPIMASATRFAEALKKESGLEVVFEKEFLTTREASHIQGEHQGIDASAAALILKSYIDKNR